MSAPIPTQLTLGVDLDDAARFENFLINDSNRQLLDSLKHPTNENRFVYLWGKPASGRTHLLQGMCHAEGERGSAMYLPLAEHAALAPSVLEGMHSLALVCIDDVDWIAGNGDWEAALFSAYNAIKESGTRLVVAAREPPQRAGFRLPDLVSRLQSTLVFKVEELTEGDKLRALQLRARNRGINLSDPVGEYILLRSDRNLDGLLAVLDRLDASTLQQKRKLTIPLVKSTMGW